MFFWSFFLEIDQKTTKPDTSLEMNLSSPIPMMLSMRLLWRLSVSGEKSSLTADLRSRTLNLVFCFIDGRAAGRLTPATKRELFAFKAMKIDWSGSFELRKVFSSMPSVMFQRRIVRSFDDEYNSCGCFGAMMRSLTLSAKRLKVLPLESFKFNVPKISYCDREDTLEELDCCLDHRSS